MKTVRIKGHGPVVEAHKGFAGLKAAASAVDVTDALLAKINGYAIKDLTAEDVFIGKQLLAHNGIDRDRERFPEELLELFAQTLPGKSTLYFHDRRGTLPLGLYFDAYTEELSPEQFKQLTGEDPRLPNGIGSVKALWALYYVVKTDEVDFVLKNILGGTYRHWSIGFSAADLVAVKAEVNGPVLYWEYAAPGEATEGSLVWLGAQQGATSQKNAGKRPGEDIPPEPKGDSVMKKLLALLGKMSGKSFTAETDEDVIVEAVKTALDAKDAEIRTLTTKVEELTPQAELGKTYQQDLVDEYARLKALLGECGESEDEQKGLKTFAKAMDITLLKKELGHLETRVKQKFPNGQIEGDDGNEQRTTKGADDDNPLIPAA